MTHHFLMFFSDKRFEQEKSPLGKKRKMQSTCFSPGDQQPNSFEFETNNEDSNADRIERDDNEEMYELSQTTNAGFGGGSNKKTKKLKQEGDQDGFYLRNYLLRTMNEMLTSQLTLTRKVDRLDEKFIIINRKLKSENI